MVLDNEMVGDDVAEQVEDAFSDSVRDFINDFVHGSFVTIVDGNALSTRVPAGGNEAVVRAFEPVVGQMIDAFDFTASDFT
jgi:hypothetical protein